MILYAIPKVRRKWVSRLALVVLATGLSVQPALAQDGAALTPHQQLARDIYRDVIAFRTARGQQQVPAMVSYLVDRFKKAGFSDDDIQVTDYDSEGEKTQGLIVTYRAKPGSSKKPIVLLGHMDVVDALAKDWVRPPFTLTEEDGYFFGRGTHDNKYGITNLAATFLRLKAEGWQPSRDLVLVFSGDEETGMISTRAQAEYVAKNIDPEFVLNSDAGGIALADDGTPVAFRVQSAEKTFATYELTVTNPGGHSSRPRSDNAIYELAAALGKIQSYRFPVRATSKLFRHRRQVDSGRSRRGHGALCARSIGCCGHRRVAGQSGDRRHAGHNLCRDHADRRTRRKCPAAIGDRHRQLPDIPRRGRCGDRGEAEAGCRQ